MKIKRLNYGQVSSGKQEVTLDGDELLIDRLIYKRLGSLTDNKNLVTPTGANSDYDRFLLDMNNLHTHKFYPEIALLMGLPKPTPDIIALDEYLGTLGVEDTYPFIEDTYSIENWLGEPGKETEVRVLVDKTDDTYLIDTTDNTVLVSYRI